MHKNFETYIKDIQLSPVHDDPEHEPPSFYLPVLPLVLANGAKGIATGFATSILPRSTKHLAKAVKEYLAKGSIARKLPITFPDFSGSVVYNKEEDKYQVIGTFERKSKTVMIITEVPYGYDREGYIKVLDALEDNNDIVSYEDQCDKTGFRFEIKLKLASANAWTDERIIRKFKLSKPLTENLTVIDQNGKLREYKDERDLIKDFTDYRLTVLQERINLRKKEEVEESRWLKVKMQFIKAVLDGSVQFKNKKKDVVAAQILKVTDALELDVDKLLRINMLSLTDEMVKDLQKQIAECKERLTFWSKTTPREQFESDLSEI